MTFQLDIIQRETGEKITTLRQYFSSFQTACTWADSLASTWAKQCPDMSVILYLH